MKKTITFLLAVFTIISAVNGQTHKNPPQIFNLEGVLAYPIDRVPEIEDGISGGLTFSYLFGLSGKMTKNEWDESYLKPYVGPLFGFVNTQGGSIVISNSTQFEINSQFKSKSYYTGLTGKLEISKGFLRPFIEAGAGVLVMNWDHQISFQDSVKTNSADLNMSSLGFLNGVGGGFFMGWGSAALEFRVSYMNSQKIKVIDVNTIAISGNNSISYQKKDLNTRVLLFCLGLTIHLN